MSRREVQAQSREIVRSDDRGTVACTVELARRYLADHPKSWFIAYYYGAALGAMSRYGEAFAALRRTARLCPPETLHLVYSQFGHLHERRGALRLAERWYRRAIEHSPSNASPLIFLGALLARAGRLPEAEAIHRQATRYKKGCKDEAFLNLGLVLRALERYPEARRCFRRALELDPKYTEARNALADIERVMELVRHA